MSSLVVQKYGGSCLATPEKVLGVAKRVARLRHDGKQVVVVVSAMGKTTDDLIRLANQVSKNPSRRELDMLLTTGERISMALLSMALIEDGCPAISFTGSQAGVLTDESHSSARITDIRPFRIEEELKKGRVVVLAGFQGVNPERKEVTTLGRGGSDTTAVAIAAGLKAEACEILKDVDGVYKCDPLQIPNAQFYSELDYKSLSEMCFWGAKVLHYRSVELAQRMQVPLFVGRADQVGRGTMIKNEVQMFEKESVVGINLHKDVRHIQIESAGLPEGLKELSDFLSTSAQPWPQILASTFENGKTRLMFTGPTESLDAFFHSLKSNKKIQNLSEPKAMLTLTCFGSVNSSMPARICTELKSKNIHVEKLLSGATNISVVIPQNQSTEALKCLSDWESRK